MAIINWKREFYGFAVEMSAAALAPVDADPTAPPEGLLWYNATSHQFTGQYAAGADVLASRSYVDAQIGGEVPRTRTIATTAPLTGGGDLSADRTLALSTATATNGGAGNAGKAIALDGAGKLAGRVIETDGAKLDGIDAGAKALDATAADIAPLGPAKVAGTVGKAADAGHVHQFDVAATRFAVFAGVDSSGGASHVAIAALKVGDQVLALINLTDASDGTSKFEATVTVAGQLQQPQASGDLSTKKFAAIFVARS